VLRLYGLDETELPAKVTELFGELDLLPVADAPFAALSRGQRYKAAFAAMVAVDPELWLLDEPFASGMDPHGINFFKRQAREAAACGRTVIYSTQILDAAQHFSHQLCVIHSGRVRAFGPVGSLEVADAPDTTPLEAVFARLREEGTP
jgi:ABC-type multidrug transport system ATPase subunit